MGVYTFKYESSDFNATHEVSLDDDIRWTDVVDNFLQFLNGVGYVIDADKVSYDTFEISMNDNSPCDGSCCDKSEIQKDLFV